MPNDQRLLLSVLMHFTSAETSEYSSKAARCRVYYSSQVRKAWVSVSVSVQEKGAFGTQHKAVLNCLAIATIFCLNRRGVLVDLLKLFYLGQCNPIQMKRWKVLKTRGICWYILPKLNNKSQISRHLVLLLFSYYYSYFHITKKKHVPIFSSTHSLQKIP